MVLLGAMIVGMTDAVAMTAGTTVVAVMTGEVGMTDESVTAVMIGVMETGTGVVAETGSEIGHFNFDCPFNCTFTNSTPSENYPRPYELCQSCYLIITVSIAFDTEILSFHCKLNVEFLS